MATNRIEGRYANRARTSRPNPEIAYACCPAVTIWFQAANKGSVKRTTFRAVLSLARGPFRTSRDRVGLPRFRRAGMSGRVSGALGRQSKGPRSEFHTSLRALRKHAS